MVIIAGAIIARPHHGRRTSIRNTIRTINRSIITRTIITRSITRSMRSSVVVSHNGCPLHKIRAMALACVTLKCNMHTTVRIWVQ